MNYWHYYIGIPSIIGSVTLIIRTLIKEREKRKRIKLFKEMDVEKIKAMGNYERKSSFHFDRSRDNRIKKL